MLDKGRGSRVTPGAACRAVYDSNPTRLTQSRMFAGNIAIHTQWSPLQSGPSPQFHSPGLRVGKASHAVVAGLFSRMPESSPSQVQPPRPAILRVLPAPDKSVNGL